MNHDPFVKVEVANKKYHGGVFSVMRRLIEENLLTWDSWDEAFYRAIQDGKIKPDPLDLAFIERFRPKDADPNNGRK